MKENELIEKVWTEKYRPDSVKNIVGNFKDKIGVYLDNPKSIPNFLFYSKTPGTGKTTLAKAIINDLKCDYLILNSSDERKIETIRQKVKDFSMTKSSNGVRKCCFMDEFDGMLKDSQNALRNLMETYSNNIFFILTCNNINKVIEPIQSRCVTIQFAQPEKDDIKKYLINICNNEKLNYSEEGINKIIDIHYPSIRNCVLKLQDLYIEKKDIEPNNITKQNSLYENIWGLILNQDYKNVKKIILEQGIDCSELNTYIFEEELNKLELIKEIKIIKILALNEYKFSVGADKNLIFISSLIDIIKVLRE